MPVVSLASTDAEWQAAATLFKEYAQWLQVDLCFQSFETELQTLPLMYGAADGGIFLCKENDGWVGCAAIRRIDDDTAELKRMYLQPGARGKGLGKELLKRCLHLAQQLGYKTIKLDTLERLHPAIQLYKQYGFVETKPYYSNPLETTVYMQKELDTTAQT